MLKKKKIIIPGLVLIFLVGVAATVVYFSDLNRVKPFIRRTVMHYTGRELTIDGNLKFLAAWPPTLAAEDLGFQNAPWGSQPYMVRVKRAAFAVSLKSLLRGDFRFFHIRLEEPEILLEFNPEGVSNFLLDIPESEGDDAIPVLAFNDIFIQNGYVEYNDQQSDLNIALHVDNLKAEIPGLDKPIQFYLKGAFKGLPCTLGGSIGPIVAWIQPGYPLSVGLDARLGGATARLEGNIRNPIDFKDISLIFTANGPSTREITDWINQGPVPELGAFAAKAELTDRPGQLAIEKLDLQMGSPDQVSFSAAGTVDDLLALKGFDLDLGLQTRQAGHLMRLADLPAPPFEAPLSASVTFSDTADNQYRLENVIVSVGDETIRGRMDLDLAQVHPVLDIHLQSKHTKLGPLALNTRIRRVIDRVSVEHLELQMGHDKLFKAFFKGAADNLSPLENLSLKVDILGKDLAHLEKLTHQPLPVRGPYAISGTLFMADLTSLKVPELKLILDRSSINGSLELQLTGQHPLLHATLSSRRLNLAALLKPGTLPENMRRSLSSVGPSRLTFELSGPVKHPALNSVEMQTRIDGLAEFELKGSIRNLPALTGTDLHLAVRGSDLAKLKKVVGHDIPFKGPYSLSCNLRNPAKQTYHLEDLEITASQSTFSGRSVIRLSGADIVTTVQLGTNNISLEVLAEGQNALLDRLRTQKDLGPLEIEATAFLSDKIRRLQSLDLAFGRDDVVRLRVNGSVGDIIDMQDLRLVVNVSGHDISNLKPIVGHTIPVKGPYALSGEVWGHAPQNIDLRNLELKLKDNHFKGRAGLNLAGNIPEVDAEIAADRFSLAPVTLEAVDLLKKLPELGPFNLAFKISEKDGAPALTRLEFRLGSESTIVAVLNGTVGNLAPIGDILLDFDLRSPDLSIFNDVVGAIFTKGRPFHAIGRLKDPRLEKITATELEVHYGDNDLSGTIGLDIAGDRPSVLAHLSSRKLDLRRALEMLARKGEKTRPRVRSDQSQGHVFSRKPLDFKPLNKINVLVTFEGREVLLRNFAFNDVDIRLKLKQGTLDVDPLKFSIGGGTAEATFALQSSKTPPFMATSLAVHQFDIGPMLQQLGRETALQGTLNTSVYLNGSGNTVAALMAGLNGKVHLDIHDGRIESQQLILLERYIGSNVLDAINPFIKRPPHTAIHCLISSIDIKNGRAAYKMVLDTEQTALASAGKIDLKTEEIDIGIKPSPKKGFGDSQVGYISFSLKELSQPFALGGTLAKPQLVLDPTRAIATAAKFAGAAFFGPVGMTLFFTDISLGKKNICEEATRAMRKK